MCDISTHMIQYKNSWFTLVEIVLSMSMVAIISTVFLSVYMGYQKSNDLDGVATELVTLFRRGQHLARYKSYDSDWWLRIQSDQLVIYRWDNYDTRDPDFDMIYSVPSTVIIPWALPYWASTLPSNPTPLLNYIFQKGSWLPTITWVTDLRDSDGARSISISINEQGAISY